MLYGTHLGSFRGLPATGREFEMRFCAMFLFEEDRLVCERVYFDAGDDPAPARDRPRPADAEGPRGDRLNHPLTVGRAVVGGLLRR